MISMVLIVVNAPIDHFSSALKKVAANTAGGICNWTKVLTQH